MYKRKITCLILLLFYVLATSGASYAAKYYRCTKLVQPNNGSKIVKTTYVWNAKIVEGTEADCRKTYTCSFDKSICAKLKQTYEKQYQACMANRKMARDAVKSGNCKVFYK